VGGQARIEESQWAPCSHAIDPHDAAISVMLLHIRSALNNPKAEHAMTAL
jgi:hypothetical protein